MAETKVVTLDVNSNIDEAAKSVGSLKAQLREAQNEVNALSEKFGATSKEAVEAAKKAAQLKDRIGDAKALTDAFNPDAKFKALTSSLSGAAGGLSAVTGAMGLLGGESKQVEGLILKVQSAMAISTGVQAIGESVDSFKQLGAVVRSFSLVQKISTAAQWLWNAAMAANPIGAIVAVVVALISAGYALVKMFQASSEAAEQNAKANSALTSELNNLEKATKKANQESELSRLKQLGLAKANGENTESIRKLTLELAKQEEAEKLLNLQRARRLYYSAQSKLLDDQENEVAKDNVAKAKEQYKKMFDDYNASVLNTKKVRIQNQIDEAQERTDANNKAKEDAQKNHDELLDKQKEANKKAAEERKKEQEARAEELKEFAKLIRDTEIQNAVDDSLQKNQEDADKLRRLTDLSEASDAIDKEYTDKEKANSDARIAIAKLEKEQKIEALSSTANTLNGLADLLGKQTTAGKVAAVASATIETFLSAQKAYSSTVGIPYVGPFLAPINAGLAVAAGLKNVKSILAVKTPGGGGGSAPSVGGTSAPAAPSFNVVGNGGTNQIAQVMNKQGVAPVQAYVVASNVTSAQSLNRNIVSNATLG